ncbi:hypothetical protein MMC14_004237 [Varicellaria rhodocarpa]|nr:hypothetical protein [Varicellaria rhodocarpa]
MFSYLQGIRPTGRRNGSSPTLLSRQTYSGRKSNSGVAPPMIYNGNNPQESNPEVIQSTSTAFTNSYTLPPIPRVASHDESRIDILSSEESSPDTLYQPLEVEQKTESSEGHNDRSSSWLENRVDEVETEVIEQNALQTMAQSKILDSHPSPLHSKSTRPYKNLFRSYTGSFTLSRESLVGGPSQDQNSQNVSTYSQEQSYPSAQSQVRSGKTKLNLLNPMSLLARRRSAQTAIAKNNISALSRNVSVPPMKLPDDYDPRIRGNMVHDFSAPRSSHHGYPNHARTSKYGQIMSIQPVCRSDINDDMNHGDTQCNSAEVINHGQAKESPTSSDRAYTPVFKEHFGLESEAWQFDKNDRRNQQTRSIMDQMPRMDDSDQDLSSLPPFARRLPDSVSDSMSMDEASPAVASNGPLGVVSEDSILEPTSNNISLQNTPTTSPPKTRSRATSTTEAPFQSIGLPRHFKSDASRFSFDFAGVGSAAQEELLEEKHRQQTAQKALVKSALNLSEDATGQDIEDDEGFFYDESEEFEGLEERIPGVNTDADDEDDIMDSQGITELKSILSKGSSTNPIIHTFNMYDIEEPQNALKEFNSPISASSPKGSLAPDDFLELDFPFDLFPNPQLNKSTQVDERFDYSHAEAYEEDDLYFDDGMIEDVEDIDGQNFDESVFDDDTSKMYGLPIREQKTLLSLVLGPSKPDASQEIARPISQDSGAIPVSPRPKEEYTQFEQNSTSSFSTPVYVNPLAEHDDHSITYHQSISLTQGNLAAYHDALANATSQAAINGKFDRKSSVSNSEHESSTVEVCHHVILSDQQLLVNDGDGFGSHNIQNDPENFSFDDNIEDDSIIAAANAEALENDDEGFYGQEFGFFARATGYGEAEYVNGGYFGPEGIDGVRRSHSGRANFQEPSLTPITERSEWSNRNSVISLAVAGGYTQPLQNAGLAQLTTDVIRFDEEYMSLSALMRLRRGAWGSSNVSLPSSAGSYKSSSPQTYLPPIPSSGTPPYELDGFQYTSSNHSLSSLTSVDESHSNSPTLKLQIQDLFINAADQSNGSDNSPNRWNTIKGLGHSRNSSGAESVSYIKDVNEEGSERWVLEKKRTFEGGKVEVLGREIVEGGTI